MIIDVQGKVVILSILGQFELDKNLIWRVLWEGITKKGKA